VLSWTKPGVPEVALFSSNHRIPATPPEDTVMFPTNASWSPKLRYADRNMPRSPIASSPSPLPACGTQARVNGQRTVNGAGVSVPATVQVEFAGFAKSTWKRWTGHVASVPTLTYGFGAPAGGGVIPSRSAGRNASSVGPPRGAKMIVAGLPASIAVRSKANACGPRNAVPDELNTFMLM